MDFPIFHLDGIGNRLLVGLIAITHVLINHGLAVGAMPLIAALEWRGMRTGDKRWDEFAYKFLFVCFIVTTTVGAMTGVGIWLSTSLVNPAAIGSLLRIFFWAWFIEWLVFITEVCLILAYFLLWKKWQGARKRAHLRLGFALGAFSWITMALIVAILGFMMSTGDWANKPSLMAGFLNPLYAPQLVFRTGLAMISAAFFCWLLVLCFTDRDSDFRPKLVRFAAIWALAWTPVCAFGAWWYAGRIPTSMMGNLAVALTTQEFVSWHGGLLRSAAVALVCVFSFALYGVYAPRHLPRWALVIPFVCSLLLLGYFERIREFIRKPYVVAGYMYANGLRKDDLPLLQRDGLLKHATYVSTREITPETELVAGRDVFLIACSRCHTTDGLNGVMAHLRRMYGTNEWLPDVVGNYVKNMHGARPYMPPFPGNDAELKALAAYLVDLRHRPGTGLAGAQVTGISLPPADRPRPSLAATEKPAAAQPQPEEPVFE